MDKTLVIIGGPTAVGKSSLSMALTAELGCPIISVDSRQVYKEMSIGTAKPSKADLEAVKHYCIDIVSIQEIYSAGKYETDVDRAISEIFADSDYAIMCGGTGLYINAFLNGLDKFPDVTDEARDIVKELSTNDILEPLQEKLKEVDLQYYESVDLGNKRRLTRALEVYFSSDQPYSYWLDKRVEKQHSSNIIKLWLNTEREALYQKINNRTHQMIAQGWIDEVKSLLPHRTLRAMDTVGYKELFQYLDGNITKDEAITEIQKQTRRYAKRQVTWFSNQYEGELLTYEGSALTLKEQVLTMLKSKKG